MNRSTLIASTVVTAAALVLVVPPMLKAKEPAPGPLVTTTTASDVCTGIPGCTKVATVDVDGDDQPDQVGIVSNKPAAGGTITVQVQTATGQTMQTTSTNVRWFAKSPWFGAAPVDGEAGVELVIGDQMGAHFQQFRVITYRDGKLVTLKAPAAGEYKSTNTDPTDRWGVDGSYSFNMGIFRKESAEGEVTVTMKTAFRSDSGKGHTGQTRVYRWYSGEWVTVSTKNVRYTSDKDAFALSGWHVKGLRRYA
ncbi:MAG: hypothetical protein AVDCRST_MAG75-2545 [uncultured Propionibacteriaceae bacterium]|uniref:Uncharacterized protein n=1 Tax=uncultured Propionibacteriaceae bacterium TaxID=257457 RepID=A0A6J4P8X1_9ACTN|nr:MAG: hypothetical protein AVDCRST_MAG75-2545 [uncultured Propionibacteriaceae bacterium]